MNKSILETKIQEDAESLVGEIKEQMKKSPKEGIDPKMPILRAVNNVISCLIFGTKRTIDKEFEEKFAKFDTIVKNGHKAANFFVMICFRFA